jgi:hypothetical protein
MAASDNASAFGYISMCVPSKTAGLRSTLGPRANLKPASQPIHFKYAWIGNSHQTNTYKGNPRMLQEMLRPSTHLAVPARLQELLYACWHLIRIACRCCTEHRVEEAGKNSFHSCMTGAISASSSLKMVHFLPFVSLLERQHSVSFEALSSANSHEQNA